MKKNIVDVIVEEFKQVDLNLLYSWKIPDKKEIELEGNSVFEKNVSLKNKLHKEMQMLSEKEYLNTAYWIVKKWGRISSFRREKINDQKLLAIKKKIDEKKDVKDVFDGIHDCLASYSKVAAFYKPNVFAVFDARVAFTLRWLFFKNELNIKYFRQIPSRNSKIKDCLTKLKGSIPSAKDKEKYYPKNEEYAEYCNLLKKVATKMGREIYEVEMFLFSIAAPQKNNSMENIKYITSEIEKWYQEKNSLC